MTGRVRLRSLAALIALCAGNVSSAETRLLDLGSDAYRVLPRNTVVIAIAAAQEIEFSLTGNDGVPRQYELDGGSIKGISDERSSEYTIEVETDDRGAVRYTLSAGRRYQIYWNYRREVWDVTEMSR